MGDRVSIRFVHNGPDREGMPNDYAGNSPSVVLFHHWGGREFPEVARRFLVQLRKRISEARGAKPPDYDATPYGPVGRLEPSHVMVQFIAALGKDPKGVSGSIYLGATPNDGDNSDNGHFDVEVTDGHLTQAE